MPRKRKDAALSPRPPPEDEGHRTTEPTPEVRRGPSDEGVEAVLQDLLSASDEETVEAAWSAFVERYTRLLLHTVRSRAAAHDGAMDRYAFVLQRLRENGFRRLRQFDPDGPGRFSTWLVVVARRLCEDFRRRRYGRAQGAASATDSGRQRFQMRSMLATLDVEEGDWSRLADPSQPNPELALREAELRRALAEAVRQLEPKDRLLLRLRFEYQLSAREISDLMGFPTHFHVYRRVRSRLSVLRRKLEASGFDGSRP